MSKPLRKVNVDRLRRQRHEIAFDSQFSILFEEEVFRCLRWRLSLRARIAILRSTTCAVLWWHGRRVCYGRRIWRAVRSLLICVDVGTFVLAPKTRSSVEVRHVSVRSLGHYEYSAKAGKPPRLSLQHRSGTSKEVPESIHKHTKSYLRCGQCASSCKISFYLS